MAQVKTKNRRPKKNKRAAEYVKPERAIGCNAFDGQTYAEARANVLQLFDETYTAALVSEVGTLNVSEMARRADIERMHVRRLLRAAGRMV